MTAKEVRATLMNDLTGVQEVFCGPQTVVYMAAGSAALAPDALKEALADFDIVVEGVERDDSVIL